MNALARVNHAAQTTFGVLAALAGIYAIYKWVMFLFVWNDAWAMSEALTWTIIMAVLLLPAFVIDYFGGD